MTTASVQDFLSKVSEDTALQSELAQALESENDAEAVTTLARSKGYEFSVDELQAEIQNRQAEITKRQESGELSEDELEAVAGGNLGIPTLTLPTQSYSVCPPTLPNLPTVKW